ncbi:MAG: response regulator [Alphaproteobacteria bacterium]
MTSKTIGIFEDDQKLLKLYGDFFRHKGFNVFEARDANVGFAILGRHAPDVVLLDVMMPQIDGFEACRRIRGILGPTVPIVFLTALDDLEAVRRAMAAGGDDFLSKSASLETVLEHVEAWLAHSDAARDALRARAVAELAGQS